MRRPMSWVNTDALSPKVQNVLIASGTKLYVVDNAAYFDCLWYSASTANVPGAITALLRWLDARVSGHVKSQARQRPYLHGTVVRPSGRFRRHGRDEAALIWTAHPRATKLAG
jgi:hypothetical protein